MIDFYEDELLIEYPLEVCISTDTTRECTLVIYDDDEGLELIFE